MRRSPGSSHLPDSRKAVAFIVRLGFAAEAADHHPDLLVNYKRVTVTYSTHSEGGLTDKDFAGRARAPRRLRRVRLQWGSAKLRVLGSCKEHLQRAGSRSSDGAVGAAAAVVGCAAPVCVSGRIEADAAGGFTERRYTPVDLLELIVLADLRRQGLSVGRIRLLLETLRDKFGIRLFEAIGGAGRITLLTDGQEIYARTAEGEFINVLRAPDQPMLVVGDLPVLKELTAKTRATKKKERRDGKLNR